MFSKGCHDEKCEDFNFFFVGFAGVMDAQDFRNFHAAIIVNYINRVQLLIEKGTNINVQNELDGSNALMIAALCGKIEIMHLLISHGANIHDRTHNEMTTLMFAAIGGCIEIVRLLINLNVNLDSETNHVYTPFRGSEDHMTALIYAAMYGHTEIVKVLIEHGANVNIRNENDETALSFAIKNNNIEMIELLVAAGAQA